MFPVTLSVIVRNFLFPSSTISYPFTNLNLLRRSRTWTLNLEYTTFSTRYLLARYAFLILIRRSWIGALTNVIVITSKNKLFTGRGSYESQRSARIKSSWLPRWLSKSHDNSLSSVSSKRLSTYSEISHVTSCLSWCCTSVVELRRLISFWWSKLFSFSFCFYSHLIDSLSLLSELLLFYNKWFSSHWLGGKGKLTLLFHEYYSKLFEKRFCIAISISRSNDGDL